MRAGSPGAKSHSTARYGPGSPSAADEWAPDPSPERHLVQPSDAWQAALVEDSPPTAPVNVMPDLSLHVWRIAIDPHKVIYGTIMLMTAYAVYDQGDGPMDKGPLLEIIGISIAPLFALAMAHAFSEALDMQIRNGRRLTGADRRHLLTENLVYLYVAIPPIIILTVLTVFSWDANDAIAAVNFLGIVSLCFWGAFAARKAGLGRMRQFVFGMNYGVMGIIVIVFELILTH